MSKMINPKYEKNKIAYLSNDFIRYSNALQPLDDSEINLFIYLSYKAKENACVKENGWSEPIEIDMKKYYEGVYNQDWTHQTKEYRAKIYKRLKRLQRKAFEVKTPEYLEVVNDVKYYEYEYTSFGYLSKISYSENTGILNVVMNAETQKFLNNCDKNFTPILFKNIISLKNKHAKLLYIFFRSYRDGIPQNKGTSYTLEHIKQVLGLEDKYPKWADFKRNVLIKAIKEINEKTDILIIGKRDVYYKSLAGREVEDISAHEYAEIVVNSMAQKASRGKSIEKIFFHVSNNDKNVTDNLEDEVFKIEDEEY